MVDILKGCAMYLVVLGHVIQTFDTGWQDNAVEKFIYMFHMPLFAFISGYFFYGSLKRHKPSELLKARLRQLILPCLSAGVIMSVLMASLKIARHSVIDYSYFAELLTSSLWYLWVMFALIAIGVAIHKLCGRRLSYLGWLVAFSIVYVLPGWWLLNYVEFLMPFFVIGIATRNVNLTTPPIWTCLIALGIFIACYRNFDFSCTVYEMQDNCLTIDYSEKTILRLVSGTAGIFLFIILVRLASHIMPARISNIMQAAGMMTLPVYALHQYFLLPNNVLNIHTDNIIIFLALAVIVFLVSVVTYKLLRKSSLPALLLFGEKKKQQPRNA